MWVINMTTLQACIVCGWKGLEHAPTFPFSSHEICSCCGTQYGLDVQAESDAIAVRKEWLEEGAPWFEDEVDVEPRKPKNWSIDMAREQIKNVIDG